MTAARRHVIVTGASSGIGAEVARALLDRGHLVWGSARDPVRLESRTGFRGFALDLADAARVRPAIEAVVDDAGHVDALINNAGSGAFGPIERTSDAALKDQFQVLVFGPLEVVRAVLPGMRAAGRGVVVNVSSLAAEFPIPFMGGYSAAKSALSALSRGLRLELGEETVRIVDLRPGDLRTGFHDAMARHALEGDDVYADAARRAFESVENHMRAAPPPALVAGLVARIVEADGRGFRRVDTGDLFQSRFSPLASRLLPSAIVDRAIRHYYGLPGRGRR